jgi:hypothetical protein
VFSLPHSKPGLKRKDRIKILFEGKEVVAN